MSPPSTWEREDHEPKSLQIEGGGGRRCRTPKSAPNSRPPSTTRSTASRGGPTSRRSSSQHPNRKYILGISFYSWRITGFLKGVWVLKIFAACLWAEKMIVFISRLERHKSSTKQGDKKYALSEHFSNDFTLFLDHTL